MLSRLSREGEALALSRLKKNVTTQFNRSQVHYFELLDDGS